MQKSRQKKKISSPSKGFQRLVTACKTEQNYHHHEQDQGYEFFETKLLDDGCPLAARYFKRLVTMEDDLSKTDFRFKKRVRDSYCLLSAIVENIKNAENTYRSVGDQNLTLRILTQTIHMIQAQDTAFNWLVKEIYKIIFKISSSWEEECSEILSRARFDYGVVLAETDGDLEEAILFMERSLEKCKDTMWYSNDIEREFLHQDVCVKLYETLLRIAAINSKKNPEDAASFAERAAVAIYGRILESSSLYCVAKLRQTEYLLASRNYKEASEVLTSIEKQIMSTDAPRNKCEFYFLLGICIFNLFPQNATLALRKFKLSLELSDKNNFADLKAQTLLHLGKIHSKKSSTHEQARECFVGAKELFQKLKDFENEKLARFLMAQLRAYQFFPNYMELIRRASENCFGYLYDLWQWKQNLLPFWNENGELRNFEDEIDCVSKKNSETK